ncbi:MAG: methyltransferase domain-containing protein [bacterium]
MKSDKDLYRQLRVLPCDKLWNEEVAGFNQASPRERMARVAVIRAVGVVFSASANGAQKAAAREWLRRLLRDPSEKIRRYAMAAIPKLGSGPAEEAELLSLLKTHAGPREKKSLGSALDKIGGAATLEAVSGAPGLLPQTEQKVKAIVARRAQPSAIRLGSMITSFDGLRIHLRCRKGLEELVRDEVEAYVAENGKFRVIAMSSRFVAITPAGPFSLADIYALRCFATVGIVLGMVRSSNPAGSVEELASIITSPLSRRLLTTLTEGSIRYRLEFLSKGHQRAAVHLVANRAYELCPDLLNDARSAPWSIDIHPTGQGSSVELRPRLSPDPRFFYREDDVAAASHPPLAACMARLAGRVENEIVWDPFCGSGLELIESALLGGVKKIVGTDLSPEAIAVAKANVAAAKLKAVASTFAVRDFRNYAGIEGLGPGTVTLVITNPPMGRRLRIPNMKGLFADFLAVAAEALKPGGRLVFPNPLRIEPRDPSLQLQYREVVDLGGFDCHLEVYLKAT